MKEMELLIRFRLELLKTRNTYRALYKDDEIDKELQRIYLTRASEGDAILDMIDEVMLATMQ